MADNTSAQRFYRKFGSKGLLQCRVQKLLVDVVRNQTLNIIHDRRKGEQCFAPLVARREIEDLVATILDEEMGELRRYTQSAASDYVVSELEQEASIASECTESVEAVDLLRRDLLDTLYEEHAKLEQRIHQWTEEVRHLPFYSTFGCDQIETCSSSTNSFAVTKRARRNHIKPYALAGDSMEEDTGPNSDTPAIAEKPQSFHSLQSGQLVSNEKGAAETPTGDTDKFGFVVRDSMKFHRESELEKYIQSKTGHFLPLQAVANQMQAFEEPARGGCLFKIVHSDHFEKVCLFVIILNIFFIFYETNYSMANQTDQKTLWINVFELMFATYYLIELAMKLMVHRLYFFCNEDLRWNLFDFFLVTFGTVELIVRYTLNDVFVLNPTFLRLFRILRVSKIFRIIRLLRFFNELRLLLKCVMGSFMSLFWSCVLLLVFTVVFAIIFVQQLSQYIVEQKGTPYELSAAEVIEIERSFGSVQLATLSLFKGMAGGNDWDPYYQMISKSGTLNGMIFLFYICLVWMSVTNIITSVFVDRAMKLALPDVDEMLLNKHKEELESAKELKRIVIDLNVTESSCITLEELQRCMKDVRFSTYLELKGLDIKDAELFFNMLLSMSDTSTVDINTFIGGCLKMKGLALNIDLLSLSYQTSMLHKYQTRQFEMCLAEIHRMTELIKQLESVHGE